MRKIHLLLFLIPILLGSCNKKTENYFEEISDKYSLTSSISNSDAIFFRLKKTNQPESTTNDSCFESVAKYKAEKSQQIESFKKLLENSEHTGYCCCPETNFSIVFYRDSEKIVTYFVDTIEFKNKVRIFEGGYQYSFLIEKQKWKNYLEVINTK
ncbi:MAG TPA: hypothetical protein VJL37_10295 [Flavobacterium sp.]|nr:hypothetical protein [Flavobacterium sp.]